MGAQTKKQTPHTPTLQMVPPPPTEPPVEDDDLPIGPHIPIDEPGLAFEWLGNLAELLCVADPGELDYKTPQNVAWLMERIAKAGHACWRREQEAGREGR